MKKKALKEQKKKQIYQKMVAKEKQEYKQRIGPIVKLLRKEGLKFTGVNMYDEKIQYFRLDELQNIITNCKPQTPQMQKTLRKIYGDILYFKRPDHLKGKYPKIVEPVDINDPQKKYACFKYDTTQSKLWIVILVILGLLCGVLFPIWPFQLKYALWLLSLVLSIVLLGLIGLRLVIYLLCVIVGYDVWIFPNLLSENSFFNSFKPIYYVEKWQITFGTLMFRVGIFGLLLSSTVYIILQPQILYNALQTLNSVLFDVHDWGVKKLQNKSGNFSQRAIENLQDILNRTADVVDGLQL